MFREFPCLRHLSTENWTKKRIAHDLKLSNFEIEPWSRKFCLWKRSDKVQEITEMVSLWGWQLAKPYKIESKGLGEWLFIFWVYFWQFALWKRFPWHKVCSDSDFFVCCIVGIFEKPSSNRGWQICCKNFAEMKMTSVSEISHCHTWPAPPSWKCVFTTLLSNEHFIENLTTLGTLRSCVVPLDKVFVAWCVGNHI